MKKIYMILAAMTLLTMSLNAQRLPASRQGGNDLTPTGIAYKYMPTATGQFRMPSLGSGEYLFGPYTTDDFDATGISYGGYYNSAQQVTALVDLTREEFESHLGDTIIGFRFALAGSTATWVYDFMAWPGNDNYWDKADYRHTWDLGQLMSGNTGSTSQTLTTTRDVTFNPQYSSSTVRTRTSNNVTITTANGDLAASSSYMTLRGNNTISTTNGRITKIVFNGYDTSYPVTRLSTTTGNYTTSNNVGTWTGNATSVTFASGNYYVDCASIVVTVETTETVTMNTVEVGRGATKSEKLPVSGWNMDYGFKNQMIYRAGQLAMANNAQIRSITFYPEEGIGIPFSGSTVTVSLANTSVDNFGTEVIGNKITTDLQTVATITPVADHDATAWTINFDTPFTYTGGNLLVQMACPGSGNFAHAYFMGDDQSARVSLISTGRSANTSGTGTTSAFLPKATFGFTGNVNTPTYLSLQGGEWHDFFLEEPVVFDVSGDSITSLAIGYTYRQLASTDHAPTAVNRASTGHKHESYMATNSQSATWWNDGISGSDNEDRPGDLAVQLIFKKKIEKTDAPTISYSDDGVYGHITATAPASDPNAVVTLTVNGTTVSGTGSVTVNIGKTDQDVTVTATATAQATDKLVSDPTEETITIEHSILPPSPAPSISSQVLDLTVEVTGTSNATGETETHMYINGVEVTSPYYLERTDQQYTVTVTVTDLITDGEHHMSTTTQTVVVPPLENIEQLLEGWTQLPGTYTNDKVINWNDNLMFIDRFTASTANNNQPAKYTYKMTENKTKLIRPLRTTNEHIIPVQLTRSKVNGFYTEAEVLADRDRQHVDTCVMNAEVEMYLENSSDIYYYTLDRSRDSKEDKSFLELSNLQGDGSKYVEVDDYFLPKFDPFQFGTALRYDTINTVLPADAAQGVNGKHYGKYGKDYIAYVPIVWTFGNLDVNKRANWDNDGKHNSYGSPIWQSSVGMVELVGKPQLERQVGKNGTSNWTEINGTDTIKCSLYMIKDLTALGYLPMSQNGPIEISNIKYEPYMFRVWVTSPTGKLRKFKKVTTENWSGYQGDGVIPANTPYWLWDEAVAQERDYISFLNDSVTQFHFWKQEEWEHQTQNENDSTWVLPEDVNMIFAAPDDLTAQDIKILVRFYYKSTGEALHQNSENNMMLTQGNRGGKSYYGVELPGGGGDPDPEIPTCIRNIYIIPQSHGEVVGVTYYNVQGAQSSEPFNGINIIVTRYSDGTTSTCKVVRL